MLLIGRQLAHDMKRRSLLLPVLSLPTVFRIPAGATSFHSSLAFAHNHQNRVAGKRRPSSRIMSTCTTTNESSSVNILPFQEGSHNSVKVVITPDFNRANFRKRLAHTIDVCRAQKKSSLWIEVPMSHASLIEDMQELGVTFHHAEGNTASLNVWLLDNVSNKVPEFATHHVGVGALVVNSRNEILCVRELRNNFRPWKLPGGLSDLGEDIPQAACREVLEETGVPCTFQSIISFRHTHNMAHGRSDLYFVCKLQPVEQVDKHGSPIIPTPVACEEEIEAAAWIPMDEYRDMIFSGENGHPMMQQVMKLYENDDCEIQETVVPSIVPGRKPSPIYGCRIQSDDNDGEQHK